MKAAIFTSGAPQASCVWSALLLGVRTRWSERSSHVHRRLGKSRDNLTVCVSVAPNLDFQNARILEELQIFRKYWDLKKFIDHYLDNLSQLSPFTSKRKSISQKALFKNDYFLSNELVQNSSYFIQWECFQRSTPLVVHTSSSQTVLLPQYP